MRRDDSGKFDLAKEEDASRSLIESKLNYYIIVAILIYCRYINLETTSRGMFGDIRMACVFLKIVLEDRMVEK